MLFNWMHLPYKTSTGQLKTKPLRTFGNFTKKMKAMFFFLRERFNDHESKFAAHGVAFSPQQALRQAVQDVLHTITKSQFSLLLHAVICSLPNHPLLLGCDIVAYLNTESAVKGNQAEAGWILSC